MGGKRIGWLEDDLVVWLFYRLNGWEKQLLFLESEKKKSWLQCWRCGWLEDELKSWSVVSRLGKLFAGR